MFSFIHQTCQLLFWAWPSSVPAYSSLESHFKMSVLPNLPWPCFTNILTHTIIRVFCLRSLLLLTTVIMVTLVITYIGSGNLQYSFWGRCIKHVILFWVILQHLLAPLSSYDILTYPPNMVPSFLYRIITKIIEMPPNYGRKRVWLLYLELFFVNMNAPLPLYLAFNSS